MLPTFHLPCPRYESLLASIQKMTVEELVMAVRWADSGGCLGLGKWRVRGTRQQSICMGIMPG